ncbi:uncharacterized protein LOC116848060 [Odontomachus brunneus]|uniref:uncharacterized protein LOC116848060 n=1 Tax=Odontomachus brunneus TaxID=486640 RepID=UPI0013F1A340|nr:uncharacterized protein LOC116848060 [Odontomachus brunneus]
MESLSELNLNDLDNLLPQMKQKLLSGTESAQMIIERILSILRNASESKRAVIVGKLVNSDMIFTICEVMQTSDENFVKIVLECFKLASTHKEFYENHAAVTAVKSMARLTYCVNKSLKDSTLFEKLVQSICNVLVRSSELAVDLNDVCDSQQIMLLVNNLDVDDLRLKLTVVTMLNVVLQRGIFNENVDEEIIIDVCCTAISSMTRIVKYSKDDNAILLAVVILCGTCAGGSRRFCCASLEQKSQIGNLTIQQRKTELLDTIYNVTMTIIIPHVKDANLSRIDPVSLHQNLVSCLSNLYQLKSCNHDNLSNHLTASGYLKYFLYLTVQSPENLRRSICILLSRILCILGKTAFSKDADKFRNVLYVGLLELPKDSADQWNNVIARRGKAETALAILLYYHYHGTQENDIVSPQSLIARVRLMLPSKAILVSVLKPLWFLFAVTSLSHPYASLTYHYESAAARLAKILHVNESKIGKFYTHHVNLMQHCLVRPEYSQRVVNKVLDLWLIESDGDIEPLLPFICTKVARRLLVVMYANCQPRVMSLAAKALRHLVEIGHRYVDHIVDIVWYMLPNILSSCESDTVAYTEVLELTNITRPHTVPTHHIERCANSIVNIISKKTTNLKFMTSIVKQAYVFLDATKSRNSFGVLKIYIKNAELLKNLYVYGFSKERSELSSVSVKLLTYVVHCQKKSSIKCEQSLIVRIKALVELLMHAAKSLCCAINGLQLIRELLTQNVNRSAVVLQEIAANADADDTDMLINLYEFLHMAHVQEYPVQRDLVYQCLEALLNFCNAKVPELIPLLCTVMSNYNLFLDVVNTRHVSRHFVKYAVVWLHYRRTTCNDVPWNSRSLYKTPFDEVLDQLREYSAIVKKKGLRAYWDLQRALSQYPSEQ